MDEQAIAYLEKNHAASMITLRADGTAHAVRVGIALVDGKLWSSGTQSRVRTKHLRRDLRSTLFVIDTETPGSWRFLTLECTTTILDGPAAADLNLQLFRVMQAGMSPSPPPGKLSWFGQMLSPDEFRQKMVDEQRLVYEFEVNRAYGMYGPAG